MTPKEKANEIFDNFYLMDKIEPTININQAKQCALISVDEIINSSPSAPILSYAGSFVNDIEESTEWWKQVKQEIEKL